MVIGMENRIPVATAATVLNSLKGGVVPRVGLEYITVGRRNEISALLQDVAMIEAGGASFRFIVGKYGSGKTFLMQALRNHVLEKDFVVTDAELSVEKRFVGHRGQGLELYKELVHNMAIRSCPDSGALPLILDKWIGTVENEIVQGGILPQDESFEQEVSKRIFEITFAMEQQVNGFDFGRVLQLYYEARRNGDEEIQRSVFRWLYGDYRTKTEAKMELGVNLIVTDDNWFEFIRLFTDFAVKAGYKGLYLCVDELAHICEIPSKVGREYNYIKLLNMYNSALQGKIKHMGILMSITKEALEDETKGIYSIEPLRTRLEDKVAVREGIVPFRDMAAPVIRLAALNPGETYVLIEKLTKMHEIVYQYESKLDHDDYIYFLKQQYAKAQNAEEITVRDMIRNYITLLNLTQQNQNKTKEEIMNAQ